jgi:hypothetical protein
MQLQQTNPSKKASISTTDNINLNAMPHTFKSYNVSNVEIMANEQHTANKNKDVENVQESKTLESAQARR